MIRDTGESSQLPARKKVGGAADKNSWHLSVNVRGAPKYS